MAQLLNWHIHPDINERCPAIKVWRERKICHRIMRMTALVIILMLSDITYGQTSRYLQQGNKLYEQQDYKAAAADYAKALSRDPNNTPGLFNLGNSLYQQKQYDSSRKILASTE